MTDQEMYDMCVEKCRNQKWEHVISAEITERIKETTHLQLQVRRLWAAVFTIFIVICIFIIVAVTP